MTYDSAIDNATESTMFTLTLTADQVVLVIAALRREAGAQQRIDESDRLTDLANLIEVTAIDQELAQERAAAIGA